MITQASVTHVTDTKTDKIEPDITLTYFSDMEVNTIERELISIHEISKLSFSRRQTSAQTNTHSEMLQRKTVEQQLTRIKYVSGII